MEYALKDLKATLEKVVGKPGHDEKAEELATMVKEMETKLQTMERPPKPAGVKAPVIRQPLEKVTGGPKLGDPVSEAVILQAFHWESALNEEGPSWYEELEAKVEGMVDAGITDVWLPPPSASVAEQGYLPTLLYQLDSNYGTKEELKSLVQKLHDNNIRAICDVVINHRCADQQDEDGNWVVYGDESDHAGNRLNWGAWAITCDDTGFPGKGHKDSGAAYASAPDLDHENPELRAALKDWLNWLKEDIGFDSWRFDFARGFAPHFIKEYIEETVGAENLNVGEFWSDGGSAELGYFVKGTNGTCMAFDFPLKGRLHDAITNTEYWQLGSKVTGKLPGLVGRMPTKSVTFVENHDTGKPQWHWPFPQEHIMSGYAYILMHPGIPTVFYSHLFGDGSVDGPTSGALADEIKALVALRKSAGITHNSTVKVLMEEDDCYMASIDDKVITKLGPKYYLGDVLPDPDDYEIVAFGKDMCVWAKRDLLPTFQEAMAPPDEIPTEQPIEEPTTGLTEDMTADPSVVATLTEDPSMVVSEEGSTDEELAVTPSENFADVPPMEPTSETGEAGTDPSSDAAPPS